MLQLSGSQVSNQCPGEQAAAVERWHPGNVTNRRNTSGCWAAFKFILHTQWRAKLQKTTQTGSPLAARVNKHLLLCMLDNKLQVENPTGFHCPYK